MSLTHGSWSSTKFRQSLLV